MEVVWSSMIAEVSATKKASMSGVLASFGVRKGCWRRGSSAVPLLEFMLGVLDSLPDKRSHIEYVDVENARCKPATAK